MVNFLVCERASYFSTAFVVHLPLPDLLKFLMSIFIPGLLLTLELLIVMVCDELSHFPGAY